MCESFVFLLDANGDPLVDSTVAPLGRDGLTSITAEVGVEMASAAAPEPGTMLFVGGGLADALVRRRRVRARC